MKKLKTECLHKELNNKTGIYIIKCYNKLYVGSSVNIYHRLKRHLSDLIRKKHQNNYLQNTFNKYKIDNFYFNVIEECPKEILKIREKYYIDKLNPILNLERNPIERIFSKKSIDQIKSTLIEGYKSGKIKSYSEKKVYRYTLDGVYIDSYNSCTKAAFALNLSSKKISAAANGTILSSGKYIWSYVKKDYIEKPVNNNKFVGEFKFDKLVRSWSSLNKAAKELNIASNTLSTRISRNTVINNLKYNFIQSRVNSVNSGKV
jgi:group I intron endonuclease